VSQHQAQEQRKSTRAEGLDVAPQCPEVPVQREVDTVTQLWHRSDEAYAGHNGRDSGQ
jgi:hypothetical protein